MGQKITRNILFDYLKDELGVDAQEIDEKSELFSSGLLDSFAVADLMVFLEETAEFQIEGVEVVMENFDSVERILKFCSLKTGASG